MIILDTDHISALQYRDSPKAFALQARLETLPPDDIATTAITVEEQTRSWLGLIHRCNDVHRQVHYYDRLISPDARSGSVMENRQLAISEKDFVAQM